MGGGLVVVSFNVVHQCIFLQIKHCLAVSWGGGLVAVLLEQWINSCFMGRGLVAVS